MADYTREEIEKEDRRMGQATCGPSDPWVHRDEKMRCSTCMWFISKSGLIGSKIGRCRRHSPTLAGYPVVFVGDWCGDHKLDENKA